MRQWLAFAVLLMGLVTIIGLLRGGATDKNSNLDRPKPAEPAKKNG